MWNSNNRKRQTGRPGLPDFCWRAVVRIVTGLSCLFLGGILPVAGAAEMIAETEVNTEQAYRKKAQVIYNLSKFIDWPEIALNKDIPKFSACVMGEGSVNFWDALQKISEKKKVQGRLISLRRIESNIAAATDCHLVLICSSEAARLPQLLPELQQYPLLTVSEVPEFAQQGGIIGLIQAGTRVHFTINLDVAKAAGLSIRAQLLVMAKVVGRLNTSGPSTK